MTPQPRVLFTCGKEGEYVRNLLLRRALRQHFDVLEVIDHHPGSLLARNLRLIPRLLGTLRNEYDLIFVGFYGYLLTLLLSRLTHKPILFDAFLSNWDTLCFDRRRFRPDSVRGKLAYTLDQQACSAARHCLLDTETHGRYFVDTFGVPESRVSAFYLGYDQELFYPRPEVTTGGPFTVFYYGSFVPLQGIEHIVQAAKLLEADKDIAFHIIGEGMTHPRVRHLAEELQVERLTLHQCVPYEELPSAIAPATVCLGGPFGSSAKASRVIAGKTFQFLAMAKATIVGDSPANREVLHHGEDVFMCQMANAQALASAILELKRDASLRAHIAQRGYELCREQFSIEKQGLRLQQVIRDML